MDGFSPFSGHLLKSSGLESTKLHPCLFLSLVPSVISLNFMALTILFIYWWPKFLSTGQTFPYPHTVTWIFHFFTWGANSYLRFHVTFGSSFHSHHRYNPSASLVCLLITSWGSPLFSVTMVFTQASMSIIFCQNYYSFLENTLTSLILLLSVLHVIARLLFLLYFFYLFINSS